ncbi:MAG: rRNA maturation RNase YbeY [Myxococcota bacterium]|nr:rRNA maturation RNase YbeY [Myxococcota bacterium]
MAVRLSGPPPGVRGAWVDVKLLKQRARGMLAQTGHRNSELSIALVDDADIRELNGEWRQKRKATDVLSFSLLEGEGVGHRGGLLGDVVISVETAARQAAARHRGLDEEVARLVVHGLLHILGHDHEDPEEAQIMRAEQRRLWKAVG